MDTDFDVIDKKTDEVGGLEGMGAEKVLQGFCETMNRLGFRVRCIEIDNYLGFLKYLKDTDDNSTEITELLTLYRQYADGCRTRKVKISSAPWLIDYVHSPNMTVGYYWFWRPSIKHVHDRFENPVGVEVGVLEGFNADKILKFANPKKLYLIDPWLDYDDVVGELGKLSQTEWDFMAEEVAKRFAGYGDKVEIRRKSSLEAVSGFEDSSLDFVYLDDDHRTEAVYKNCVAWWPKLRSGGVLCGHDAVDYSVFAGVTQFLKEARGKYEDLNYKLLGEYNDWWIDKP